MRLLVCGSRDWSERERAQREIAALVPDVLIHGAAGTMNNATGEGLTSDVLFACLAREWAWREGRPLQIKPFPAEWARYHRPGRPNPAGPIRNARMLAEGKPDRGLAFGRLWTPAGGIGGGGTPQTWKHTGTADVVAKMLRAGLPVRWIAAPDAPAIDLLDMPQPGGAS